MHFIFDDNKCYRSNVFLPCVFSIIIRYGTFRLLNFGSNQHDNLLHNFKKQSFNNHLSKTSFYEKWMDMMALNLMRPRLDHDDIDEL